MVYIGIDVSINSTGVVIEKNDEVYFLSFAANLTDRKINNSVTVAYRHLLDFDNFELVRLNRKHLDLSKKEKNNYSYSELIKLEDAITTSEIIKHTIEKYIDEDDEIKIGFEGFSHGSRGSSKNDIAGITYLIRNKLFEIGHEIHFFAPKSLKKFAGRELEEKTGNAGKLEMFEMFRDNALQDKQLENSKIYQFVNNEEDEVIRKNKVKKPFDDIIDAYFVMARLKIPKESE